MVLGTSNLYSVVQLTVLTCLGQRDGGKTVRADNPILNQAMDAAGQRLNLAPHLV